MLRFRSSTAIEYTITSAWGIVISGILPRGSWCVFFAFLGLCHSEAASVSTFTSLLLIKSLSRANLTLFSLFCLASLATGYNLFLFCSITLGNCSLIPYRLPLKVSLASDLINSLSLNFSKLAIMGRGGGGGGGGGVCVSCIFVKSPYPMYSMKIYYPINPHFLF